MSDFPAFQVRVNFVLSGTIEVVPLKPPSKPSGQFTFIRNGDGIMIGTFQVNAPNPSEGVTALSVVVTVAGTPQPSVDVLDLHPVDFPCNDNELCSATVTASSVNGTTVGDPVEATATITPGGGTGTAPSKVSGTFSFRP